MSELARDEDLNPTMLSRVVARMAERGLLAREQHPDDRRAVLVTITDDGIAKRDEMRRARTDALAHELEGLTDDEAAALEAALPVLERLGATLRPRT
jgi:DNA-binding MarR family transcriptional regulator